MSIDFGDIDVFEDYTSGTECVFGPKITGETTPVVIALRWQDGGNPDPVTAAITDNANNAGWQGPFYAQSGSADKPVKMALFFNPGVGAQEPFYATVTLSAARTGRLGYIYRFNRTGNIYIDTPVAATSAVNAGAAAFPGIGSLVGDLLLAVVSPYDTTSLTSVADGFTDDSAMARIKAVHRSIPSTGPYLPGMIFEDPTTYAALAFRLTETLPPPPVAQFAGDATALSTATAALTTAIRLASDAAASASATGSLLAQASFAGDAQGIATAAANLSTAIQLAGAAQAQASATGALTDWQSVTLADPLYTGPGSILDDRYWTGAPPLAGHVVYFDASNGFSIASNGEISATINGGSWLVQYFDGVSFSAGLVQFQSSELIAGASAQSGATGSLTTAVLLAATAAAEALATGSLATPNPLSADAQAVATAAANLFTQIQLVSDAQGQATATGSLDGLAAQLEGAAQAVATAQGDLSIGISSLQGDATALATASALLDTAINLLAFASASADASGTLEGAAATLVGAAEAVAEASATLSVGTLLSADAFAAATALADLSTAIRFAADANASAEAIGGITTLGPVVSAPRGTPIYGRSRRPRVLH